MRNSSLVIRRARIGEFEIDLVTGELSKDGAKVNIPVQPLRILAMLLEKPGELVTREELQQKLWADTFVDKEHSLNAAVKRLRALIADEADSPRFIETIPRRGYRFIGQVEVIKTDPADSKPAPETLTGELPRAQSQGSTPISGEPAGRNRLGGRLGRLMWLVIIPVVLLIAVALSRDSIAHWLNNHGTRLQQKGEIAEAIRYYERALVLYPSYPEAHYNLAYAYEELSQYETAMTQYERAIELDDKFYEAYNNLSRLYILRRNDSVAALGLLDRALNNKPQDLSVQYSLYKNRGWANLQLQYLLQAERDLRLAISLAERRASAHCLLAQVKEAQKENSLAIPEWEACVAYAPAETSVEPSWLHLAQERLEENDKHK